MAKSAPKKVADQTSPAKPRGRPPGSKNQSVYAGPLASAPETNGPSDDDIKGWLAEATEIETAMARVRQKMSTLKKDVEGGAGDWKALKAALASTKLSKAEAIANLEAAVRYHKAISVRVSFDPDGQGTFADLVEETVNGFSGAVDEKLSAARAKSDGFNSSRLGGTREDNPFNPGSLEYAAWQEGLDQEVRDRGTTILAETGEVIH